MGFRKRLSYVTGIEAFWHGNVGFETYSSWWKFKNVAVKRLSYQKIAEQYVKEF